MKTLKTTTKTKKVKTPEKIRKIYSEVCGDCFYNEEGECFKNPEKCIYNFPPKNEDEDNSDIDNLLEEDN